MPKRSRKYEIGLADRLKDRRHAVNYLNAAADDSEEAFLLALRDVAEALKGMSRVSADAHVNRENLYRMLSEEGNPRYSSFRSVLKALHLKFRVEEDSAFSKHSPPTSVHTQITQSARLRRSAKIGQLTLAFDAGSLSQDVLPARGATYVLRSSSYSSEELGPFPADARWFGTLLSGESRVSGNFSDYQKLSQWSKPHGEAEKLQASTPS